MPREYNVLLNGAYLIYAKFFLVCYQETGYIPLPVKISGRGRSGVEVFLCTIRTKYQSDDDHAESVSVRECGPVMVGRLSTPNAALDNRYR